MLSYAIISRRAALGHGVDLMISLFVARVTISLLRAESMESFMPTVLRLPDIYKYQTHSLHGIFCMFSHLLVPQGCTPKGRLQGFQKDLSLQHM